MRILIIACDFNWQYLAHQTRDVPQVIPTPVELHAMEMDLARIIPHCPADLHVGSCLVDEEPSKVDLVETVIPEMRQAHAEKSVAFTESWETHDGLITILYRE
jgi:hypothetical protein